MKYIYILNRFKLLKHTDEIIRRLEKASAELDRDYEIVINESVEDAKNNIKNFKDTEYIITAIGGDGSINLLLNNLINTKNILSFVPHGTGNDFCRACFEKLEDGIHDVDIIRINDSYFINIVCFGIDADVANDDSFIRNRFIPGSMRYDAGLIYHFFTYKARKMKIECEGESIEKELSTVVVANNQYYGGGYRIAPESLIDDGQMEVYVVDKLNKIKMASIIHSLKDGSHLKSPALQALKAKKAVISSDKPIKANFDGEPMEACRFELEMIPKGFRIEFNKDFINRIKL